MILGVLGRRHFSIWGILALISVGAGGFCSCTQSKKADDAKLVVYHGTEKDDVKTWDPANAYDSVSLDLVPSVYETLYQYSYLKQVYQLEPLLAERMPLYSKDRLTVTIPIKKGIHFQDDPCFTESEGRGRELKAQDFVYGLKRLALPSLQSQGWWVLDGKVVGVNEFHDKLVKASSREETQKIFDGSVSGIQAIDDYTLQLKLKKPYPQLLFVLAMSFASPVPHEAVAKYADPQGNLLDHPVGTGPFRLTRWDRNHEIVLDRNPGYRVDLYPSKGDSQYQKLGLMQDAGRRLPFVDRISIDVVKEAQPGWLNFVRGNTDALPLPKDNFRQAITSSATLSPDLSQKGIKLSVENGVIICYISFNMRDQVFGKNKYLRQALASAIDRDRWIEIFTNNTGRKMVALIPPGIKDRPPSQKLKYDYDLVRAKELLKKAGYPGGVGLPPLRFDLRGASTTDRQLGEFFLQQFAQIGVKVDVVLNTFPAFLEKMKQGNLQISVGAWIMDYPDAENILQLLYGPNQTPGPAESNYDNPVFNELYEKMGVLESGKKRADLVRRMDDLVQEDCPWALGYYEASYDLTQPWVYNYRKAALIQNRYKYYRVDKTIKAQQSPL